LDCIVYLSANSIFEIPIEVEEKYAADTTLATPQSI